MCAAQVPPPLHYNPPMPFSPCSKMDCPRFTTKEHTDNWDVREYDAGE
jgi:hypothetical protein